MVDFELAGIGIIQIDEPALRERLLIKQNQWAQYFAWAVDAFKLSAAGVQDSSQIYTYMCYSVFNDTNSAIAADVLIIEISRSRIERRNAFEYFSYPSEIVPMLYDIHSANIPTVNEMVKLLTKAAIETIMAEYE